MALGKINSVRWGDPNQTVVTVNDTVSVPDTDKMPHTSPNKDWLAVREWIQRGGQITPYQPPGARTKRQRVQGQYDVDALGESIVRRLARQQQISPDQLLDELAQELPGRVQR